jgi:hypothetical protein
MKNTCSELKWVLEKRHQQKHCKKYIEEKQERKLLKNKKELVNSHAFITEANKGNMAVLYKRIAKIKLHRPGNLVRLVVSWQRAPEYSLSRYLTQILRATHIKPNMHNIKSSCHLTERTKSCRITV